MTSIWEGTDLYADPRDFRFCYRCAGCGEVFSGDAAEFAALGARVIELDEWTEDPYCGPCWAAQGAT